MNKILSNIFKGLLVSLVLVITAGIISLNVKMTPNTSMVLVSSSLVNSIQTNEKLESDDEKEIPEEEKVEDAIEEKEEIIEEIVEIPNLDPEPVKEVEEKKEEVKVETPKPEPQAPLVPTPSGTYTPNNDSAASSGVSATYTGLVTAYGPDCTGCYGSMTAMGDYVGEGNIYYNHPTYGTIRIVAGDKSILNKVVRITGLNISSEPVIAIVRDTGGDIGFNKPKGIILDLLYTSERSPEVLNFGMQQATVEVLS